MNEFEANLLTALVVLPFAGALVLVVWPRERIREMQWLAASVAAVCAALTIYVLLAYDHSFADVGEYQFVTRLPWLASIGVTWHMGVDGIAVSMLFLSGVVHLAAILIAWRVTDRAKAYLILLNILVGGVYGVFATIDLFFLFFFYEVAVLPMYLLIAIWGSSSRFKTFARSKEYSAMKLVLYLVAGSIFIWIALIAIFAQAGIGSFNLIELKESASFPVTFQRFFFPFLLFGFGLLAGLWPLHTWSPDGHVAAPTSVSMLHAGVLMKLGAYGIIRVGIELFPEGAQFWAPVMIGLGTVNVLYGAMSAMSQRDIKYVIGYSSVSHMGYVLLGIGTLTTLGMTGAVMQMFSHGIMTALFFAMAGAIYDRAHTRDMTVITGLAKTMPLGAVLFAIAGLASIGLPGLSGFVAELLVFLGLFQSYPVVGVLAIIGVAITAVYVLRLLSAVFFGTVPQRFSGLKDISRLEVGVGAGLALGLLVVGLAPFHLIDVVESGVRAIEVITP